MKTFGKLKPMDIIYIVPVFSNKIYTGTVIETERTSIGRMDIDIIISFFCVELNIDKLTMTFKANDYEYGTADHGYIYFSSIEKADEYVL